MYQHQPNPQITHLQESTKYYYDIAGRILEERNGSDQTIRQNVWGTPEAMYIDELVQTGIIWTR